MQSGVQRALDLNHGVPPTYFTYRVEDYDVLDETDAQGRSFIRAKRFTPQVLPLFLEGPVHAFKVLPQAEVRRVYQQIKASPLFDQELKMYKVNASLADQPHDIGRARAFVPGWLENESIWLHMEYKYLLEVLRAGLYEEFYADFQLDVDSIPRSANLWTQPAGKFVVHRQQRAPRSIAARRGLCGAPQRIDGGVPEPLAVDDHRATAVLS